MTASPARGPAGGDEVPAPRAVGPSGWEPVITCPDPLSEEEWLASVDATAAEGEPWWLEGDDPGPEARPGMGRFASGMPSDAMPGSPELARLADDVAGPDDRFGGISDDELVGVLCAWGRVESHAAARKYAAIAELARRRPASGSALAGAEQMPREWDEFAATELAAALAESRADAAGMLGLAYDLEVRLPATRAALRDGTITLEKAEIIAHATAVLDDDEAREAEGLVLGRAGKLTPDGLRSAIARAVMQVNPDKARKRRERGARQARVERWSEASGNAGLAGRELPPTAVLAADQKVSAWARQLRKAGLEGGMDALRARAFLDLLLGTDSRPPDPADPANASSQGGASGTGAGPGSQGDASGTDGNDKVGGNGGAGPDEAGSPVPGGQVPGGPGAGPGAGCLPAGFAGRVNLTVTLATLLGLADCPGELPGLGPIDPALAADLARAAARNPWSTWCVTVTDQDGHAIGHGCARPGPPGEATPAPGFTFTGEGRHGPPGTGGDGGYGTWRLSTGSGGKPDLLVTIHSLATDPCGHRYRAKGHDPGVMLRHLTQIRYATCTGPGCRRPSARADYEHNIPYEAGGLTCLCNGNPKCRFDHRLKQDSRWKADQRPDGALAWTTPSGRQWIAEPTRYPVWDGGPVAGRSVGSSPWPSGP